MVLRQIKSDEQDEHFMNIQVCFCEWTRVHAKCNTY
jgi:formate dehydrogenase maturation protein FdhE